MIKALEILRLLDAAAALAISAGINLARYNELKAQNDGGDLTDEQLVELAEEARRKVDRL